MLGGRVYWDKGKFREWQRKNRLLSSAIRPIDPFSIPRIKWAYRVSASEKFRRRHSATMERGEEAIIAGGIAASNEIASSSRNLEA